MLGILYVLSMIKIGSPALFDPALFWGVVVFILFCFHKSCKVKKEKENHATWQYLAGNWHDLLSFVLRGFYELQSSHPAPWKISDNRRLTPNRLRLVGFSQEQIFLPAVSRFQSEILRRDGKARRRCIQHASKRVQTFPLSDKSVLCAVTFLKTGARLPIVYQESDVFKLRFSDRMWVYATAHFSALSSCLLSS
jgi:hypothetical protein